MLHLKSVDGNLTYDPNEILIAFDFDTDLFGEGQCNVRCMEDLHKDLSKLNNEQSKLLDSDLQLKELTELSTGKESNFGKVSFKQIQALSYTIYCYLISDILYT